MKSKVIALALFASAAIGFASEPAKAQAFMEPNCSQLNGTPLVCVTNRTSAPITSLSCNGSAGNWTLLRQNDVIMPSQTYIINFSRGICDVSVTALTMNGGWHTLPAFNYNRTTKLNVQGW